MIFQGDTQYASPGYASRFNQYGGSGLPLAQFGGYLSVSGGGGDMYNTYLTRYNVVHNIDSPVSMGLSADIVGNQIMLQADIEVVDNISTSNNKIVFILTSYQDEDYFCSVISYDYQSFNLNGIGSSNIFEHTVDIDPSWDINEISYVAIVQSFNDNHILQAGSIDVPLNNLLSMDTQISFVDDQVGGDGDGVPNPGEDVHISVDIINESLELSTSTCEIIVTSNSDGIDIIESDFMHSEMIASGQLFSAPIPISISEDIELGQASFNINLECSYIDNYSNELIYSKSYDRYIDVNLYQFGFPYIISSQILTSPAVVDIDGDYINEIIFGDYLGNLHVINQHGEDRPGFPIDLGDQIWGSPAVADIDNDGDIEIIANSKNKRLHIINADGSNQFEYNTGQYLIGTPALGNIDDDDDLEIIFGGYSSSKKLYAINPDGSDVNGFPLTIGEKMMAGVALTDFNDNGKVDIVVGTDSDNIYLIYDDGTIAQGFPFEGDGDFKSDPIILDSNGSKMILAGSKDGTLYSIDPNGDLIFSIETSDDIMSSPTIISRASTGPIIFFGNDDGEIHAIYPDGNYMSGWPITLSGSIISSPIISDLNSDMEPEIIVTCDDGNLYILSLDGTYYENTPLSYPFPYTGSVMIDDLDFDGDLEVFCGSADGLNVFDIKEPGISHGYWNIFKGNLNRDGYYADILIGDVNYDNNIDILDVISLVNYILGNIENLDYLYADINHDGSVDITDIILTLNYILID